MNEPMVPGGIRGDDWARGPVRGFARLSVALVIAIASMLPPPAQAQQANSGTSPAPSTAARPALRTDTASALDAKVTASITSDYNYRGYTLSDHQPSASANLEVTYN